MPLGGERYLRALEAVDLVLFASSALPAARRRVPSLHGTRPLTRGTRYALGPVFHLAR